MYLHHFSELCEEILSDALNAFLYSLKEGATPHKRELNEKLYKK